MSLRQIRWSAALVGLSAVLVLSSSAPLMADYVSTVLASNPVVYYQLNEPASTAQDGAAVNSGTGGASYNATYGYPGSYPYTAPEAGVAGPRPNDTIDGNALLGFSATNTAAYFDGGLGEGTGDNLRDLLYLASPLVDQATTVTASVWFKTTSAGSGADAMLILQNTVGSGNNPLSVWMDGGQLALKLYTSDVKKTSATTGFNDGNWHNVVAVRDGGTLDNAKIYVDGVEMTLTTENNGGAYYAAAGGMRIGARSTNTQAFIGSLDEVCLWDRALTGTDVAALYQAALTADAPAVPEPGTAMLLTSGVLGLLAYGRRRGK